MNIGIVISNSEMGGAQRVAINIAKWISLNTDNVVCVIALQDAKRESYDMAETDYVSLHGKGIVIALRRLIKRKKLDVVITMGVPLTVYTVPACIGTQAKLIISERNDPAHFSGKSTTRILSRNLMRFAHGYVFQTNDAKNFYGNKIAKKSIVIANPLLNTSNMPKTPFNGERKKIIVSVGRLNKQKNQAMLIESFREIHKNYPDYKLLIWGEGPERDALEKRIKNYGLEHYVSLPGNTDRVQEKIYEDSIFVMCSDFEGMPNALMEAMAMGLACVSTDCPCGGPRELIEDGYNGLLVPVNDIDKLTERLSNLIDHPEEIVEIGTNAIKIREQFDISKICKQWIDYISCVNNN